MAKTNTPDSENELNGDFVFAYCDDNSINEEGYHIHLAKLQSIKKTIKENNK